MRESRYMHVRPIESGEAGPKLAVQFLGIELQVGGAVLRPRKETELLGRVAQRLLDGIDAPICVDMCCGSGNLALALASHSPQARVTACDLTDDAVESARHNVRQLGYQDRIAVVQGDLFAPLAGLKGQVDLIVANPPYISTSRLTEGDRSHLLAEEPREAFDGGPYGISLHSRLIAEGAAYLRTGGWLAFEFGLGQDRQVAALLKRARVYGEPVWHLNEDGEKRVVCVRKA
jgi:release factor glutamine methyltransferase